MSLHMFDVYGCEEEIVIAESVEDARAYELTIVKPEDLEYAVFDQYADDRRVARVEDGTVVTKTVREWCEQEGRGFFASCYA